MWLSPRPTCPWNLSIILYLPSPSPFLLSPRCMTVNHYKCPLCDMTCPSPSAVRDHVRYRHSDERTYQCPACDHRWVTLHRAVTKRHLPFNSYSRRENKRPARQKFDGSIYDMSEDCEMRLSCLLVFAKDFISKVRSLSCWFLRVQSTWWLESTNRK